MGNKKALIVTHPQEMFDWSCSLEKNLESFISEHRDYDIIRLIAPGNDSYFNSGKVISSNYGHISEPDISEIVANYDKIVTAGGYFKHCAQKTFHSLVNGYFNNPKNQFSILIPLNLFYEVNNTQTMESTDTYDKVNRERINKNNLAWHFRRRLNEFETIARFFSLMDSCVEPKIVEKLVNGKVVSRCNGIDVCGVVSYKNVIDL